MRESNACSRGQGDEWVSPGRCWATTVLSTAQALIEQVGICPWSQCFIIQMWNGGTGILLLFQPWKSDLEPFLATTREMFIPICCEIPPSQIHLSVPCAFKIHLLISVVVVKKHVSRQWDSSTPWILGVWRKVALGCISEIFAVYLSGWFIQGGFNVFFYSQTHPIGQAVF